MNKYSVPYITLVRSQCYSRQHIIGLYGTPAVRQALLRLAWYGWFDSKIRFERKNDSQVPTLMLRL